MQQMPLRNTNLNTTLGAAPHAAPLPVHSRKTVRFKGKYFFDTEFIQHPNKSVDLISIGVTSDDGREFYAVSSEFDEKSVSYWVRDNVLSRLGPDERRLTHAEIRDRLKLFVGKDPKPEFYLKGADIDWTLFCEIFGGPDKLPWNFPKKPKDVEDLWNKLGKPELPEHPGNKHNALADARWTRTIWKFLNSLL